ncbi:MAG: CDP-glucose 4,6-dehydratase [Gammaproteobacteria bacterium]|jgi:CDP-glucose 4,6-dehydratase|nr:CDP-glucose 4,6-dehydratase [Candidatus Neomarinimicrobiota bacterium]MBE05650.1 CDP-glucose 4,6-dehydratase [Gammaproteobacteria bacterium]|tara:strand:+ start:431 stop:1519 length:1089 start_codon:yes stop_codon:yes gene_type:complete
MFNDFYTGKKILVTGHTGFKGSWLCTWLLNLGAEVTGYSIDVPSEPSLFEDLRLSEKITDIRGDVRDLNNLKNALADQNPDLIFHLAAQPIVRRSYDDPVETFTTNAIGSMNILEAVRESDSVKSMVMITSDKAYRNVEWIWGYKEDDLLGGEDPYSSSKGCAELIFYSYVNSYFKNNEKLSKLTTARAGNVIGGGDWAKDRIVPDIVRSFSKDNTLSIRAPNATRPWQHVLEPLSGYLTLAMMQVSRTDLNHESFNFGPRDDVNQNVLRLVEEFSKYWDSGSWEVNEDNTKPEAGLLKLNCDKAHAMLDWKAILSFEETINFTGEWYKAYFKDQVDLYEFSVKQISDYSQKAKEKGLKWAE